MRILYITHYSIMEPLGQSQILPYLKGLAERGFSIDILSFEKPGLLADSDRVSTQKASLSASRIEWFPRPYHSGASLFDLLRDIFRTAAEVLRHSARNRIDLIHCRTHVPFLIAWFASLVRRIPILFDFRGFIAEEYVDAGLWNADGIKYRITKLLERSMTRYCSSMVVLTDPVRKYLADANRLAPEKVFVIPCCVDLSRFGVAASSCVRPPGGPLNVVYSGSTEGRYDLKAMLRFFARLRAKRPGSHFTILSTGDLARVGRLVEETGLPSGSTTVATVSHAQVAEVLREQDLGLFFLRGGLTLLAASPTKIGEYLAGGLVVVAETGIGGLEEILGDEGAGILARSDQPETWDATLDAALQLCDQSSRRERALRTAKKFYSLQRGIDEYAKAYGCALRTNRKVL